jgi:hypothetical protein
MRFIEIPALITEDIEDPSIVDITEEISVSISGTTMTIDGGSKVSGEATITLTGDTTVNAFTLQNIKHPSLHKISVKTGRKGNFTYVPNDTVTASSVSTTTKTGSDFEILLITTNGDETYVDFDMADYTSPALYTSNALTGFDISELTSTYGATAKLYKPDGTLLTTVNSATTGGGVNFGYTESTPGDVTYTLEVEDDLGRTSRYDLPRKWISYAMETNSTPGFEKLALAGNEYTSTTIVPNISTSSKARVYKTGNHGYLGINFKIQGRNTTNGAWVDIDDTGENENADESKEFLAFGNYKYHRVWVKPTAKASTTVSSSNVVTLTLSNLTEENVTTSFTGVDPFDINESTNTYVFEETTKIGTVPFTVTLGTETYTNAVSATTEGTAYDYVTLAFANPTLSLTTSNVTISSAKLYRDDVLFHTYGTESNVVLRSDQTGTYQAVVNDVYYSNRVTPDFTTTRSVSAPQLEFDGYNKLTLANYITTTSDFPSIITFDASAWDGAGTTIWYVLDTTKSTDTSKFYETNEPTTGDAGNDGTATGIEFRCESDGTTKVYANTDDNTSQPNTLNVNSTSYPSNYVDGVTITSGDVLYGVESSFTRFGFTVTSSMLFTRTVITPTSTTLGVPDGTTRDLTTQSSMYIYEPGTYTANVQTSETFAYLSNVVTWEITIKTSNSYNLFQNFGTTDYTDTEGRTIENLNSYSNGNLSGSDLASWTDRGWTDSGTINLHDDGYNVTGITGDISTNFHGSGSTTGYFDKTLPSDAIGIIIRFGQTYNNSTGRAQVFIYNNGTEVTSTSSKSYSTTLTEETLYFPASPNNVIRLHESGTGVFAVTHILTETYTVTPKLTFDGYNKLTLENLTQTSSTLEYGSNTYDTNTASNVYVTDAGEYKLEARDANTFVMSNVYVGAVDTVPGFTAAFHHGAFSASDYSSAYSSVAEAATAGFVYSDTPAGEYTWGTLAHVKERENPDFTANSTLHTDYNSTYGWTTNSGWEVSAKDEFSTTYEAWKAFSKTYASNNNWLSGSAPSENSPQWIKIKYPSSQVIKSYVIRARENASPRWPTAWKLQGSNNDSDWTDIGSEQTQTEWVPNQNKSFDLSTNTTAYQYYRLRITGARESASLSNSDYVAIGHWFLLTETSGSTVHTKYTRYTYTPPASTITANVLRVAGGGGGSGTRGGGGGAGGLLYSENVSLSGTKSIVVGNGGIGYEGTQQSIENGYDTVFTGLTTSIGGGHGGGNDAIIPTPGGSGGGGSARIAAVGTGAAGTSGQGNAGGDGSNGDTFNGGGGGGAGAVGGDSGGVGGVGLDYSSVFGTTYGVSGFFAGGGGGGTSSGGNTGGNGGGGGGSYGHGTKHTGGGGAGIGNGSSTSGDGGSGIVLIKKLGPVNPSTLNFDGYNKLTIDNVDTVETATIKKDGAAFATTTSNTVYIRDTGTYTAEVKGSGAYAIELSKVVSAINNAPDWRETQFQLLYSENPNQNDQFGSVVDIDGDYACIGSPYDDTNVGDKGAVYVFHKSNGVWTYQDILQPDSTSENFAILKSTLSIHGDTIAVGAQANDTGGADFGAVYVFRRNGTSWSKEAKLQSNDVQTSDNFGSGVGIYGDYIVGGAYAEDTGGSRAGSAYIFKRTGTTWEQTAKIQSGDQSEDDKFGIDCKIYGDYVIVSAPEEDLAGSEYGAAYIFKRDALSRPTTNVIVLSPADWGSPAQHFHRNPSLDTTTSSFYELVQGTSWGTGTTTDNGHGIELRLNGTNTELYVNSDNNNLDPITVSIGDGTASSSVTLISGQTCTLYKADGTGYSFTVNSGHLFGEVWSKTETLLASDGAYLDRIGYSVGIYDEYAIVGAQIKDYNGGTDTGGAYIFKKNVDESWTEQAILISDDPIDNYQFGASVYIKGNYAIVGEPGDSTNTGGFMYVFERSGSTWTQIKKFQVTNGQDANFGTSVAISGDTILSGAPYDDVKDVNTGVCYVFSKTPPGPYVTFDNYNKITLNQLNYEDTATVSDPNGSIHEIGTAKTMYVKDTGEYVFKISGTDKYVESNVYVSSVDLEGAPTKPIDFDGYNKLTLIDAGSNVSANVTYFSNTYELGSANVLYINGAGTYDLEMSGSNVFALSSNVVGSVIQNVYFSDSWDWTSSSSLTSTDGNTTLTSSGSPTYDISNGYYSFDTAGEYFTLSKNSISSQLALNVNDMVIDFEMYNAEGPSVNYFVFGGNSNARRFYTYNGNQLRSIRSGYNATSSESNGSYLAWARHTIWFVANTLSFKYYIDGTLLYTYTSSNAADFYMRDFPFHFGFYSIESGSGSAETRLRKFHYELSNGRITESLIANPDWYGLKPIPSLTFDTYNKLTLENFTTTESDTRTAKLTDPNGDTYSLGQTQNDIYIEDTGDYILEVTNSDQSAVVAKTVTGTLSPSPGTPLMTNVLVTRSNGSDYTEASPSTGINGAWESIFVIGNTGTVEMDGADGSSGIGFSMYLNFDKTFTVNTVVFKMISTYQTYKNISFRCGVSDSDYITVDPGEQNYSSTQTITFTFSSPITVNKLYFAVVQDGGSDLYNLRITNGDIIINGLAYPLSDSDKVLPSPVLNFDGYNKLSIENITPISTSLRLGSNTYDIGTASNVYIEDAGTYKFATGDATTFALVSNVVGTGQISEPPVYSSATPTLVDPIDITDGIWSSLTYQWYQTHSTYYLYKLSGDPNDSDRFIKYDWVNLVWSDQDQSGTYSTFGTSATDTTATARSVTNPTHIYLIAGLQLHATMVNPYYQAPFYPPSLTYDTSNKLSIENLTPTSTTLTDPNGSSFDIGTASNVYIRDSGTYSIASKDANTFLLASTTVTGTPTGTTYVYDSNTFTTPSQTYDTTKTITVSNVPSTQMGITGKIYKGSTAYPIHATTSSSNVIIKNTGTYVSVFTTATQAFLTNAIGVTTQPTTTSDDTTIEDAAPLVTTTTITVQEQDPETFSYTGVIQTYTVPDGVTSIKVKCWGAAGGSVYGGAGGYAGGDVSVTPGDTIQVVVGQGGRTGGSNLGSGGGFTGILSVWNTSDIAATHAGSIIIAGAGGGGGNSSNNPAGNGGGETGGVGQNDASGAKPGTQTAAGSAESDTSAATNPTGGSYFRGGNSAGNNFYAATPWPAGVWGGNYQRSKASGGSQGGGGGGGYYGAGGAGNRNSVNSRGAAGGSGYIGGDGTHEVTNGENLATSLTQKSSLPPKTDDEHYVSGTGTPASTDTNGGDGLVVIIATKEVTTTTTTGGLAGSTAVPTETTTDAPSVTLDATDTTVTDPTLDLDFTTQLPRTLKRYNGLSNSSIGARFNRRESRKKRIEKRISIPTSFSAELTANNASSPTTLTVTVANSKFVINGDETPTLGFIRGETYTFDQSDASNSGHPLVLATSADGATQYTTGWTASGTPGTDGSHAFIVPYDVPDTIYYKCSIHPNMGGEIHTTFGNVFSLGDFTVAANTHVSGEYTLATNYDGTTSNLYVNGDLITQTTPSPAISAGVKDFILGKEFDGYVKNFKFWNYAKRFFATIIAFHHDTFANSGDPYNDGSVTVAAANGHVFSDTDTSISYTWGTLGSANYNNDNTTYTWTPASAVTAKVLMVAGGGGGGNSDNINGGGGGGGAGGLVYNSSVSLSGQKTITVGGPNSTVRGDGTGSTFTGLTSAVGGGKGAGAGGGAGNGGSGGGAFRNGTGGAGTEGQGYAGGDGNSSGGNDQGGSGGGGAGGGGAGANGANGANGGVGLDYSSVFGTAYGDSGWFASGGGGGFHSGSPGTASNGGGGNGGSSGGSAGGQGQKHTGGGGGGGSIAASSNNGSYGGSGIVLIKY